MDINAIGSIDAIDDQSLARPDAPGAHPAFDRLVRTIWRLRQSDGCPWDREQTHGSIRRNMIEEAYEAVEAIDEGDAAHLEEELGDVLMQVLLHAQIADDAGEFGIDDVARGLNEKLIRRHPHVFGAMEAADSDAVLGIWETVKAKERVEGAAGAKSVASAGDLGDASDVSGSAEGASGAVERPQGLLDSVPRSLPALMQCQKLSARAARVGFEWSDVESVWQQVAQERAELDAEEPGSDSWAEEFGDLLFSLVNVARWEGIDAESALEAANAKFRRRWAAVEGLLAREGLAAEEAGTAHLNELWERAKRGERGAR